jgi:hypothetical protein
MNTNRVIPKEYLPLYVTSSHPDFLPIDPNYIAGFTNGDGCFTVTTKLNSIKGFGQTRFSIGQHINNTPLMVEIKEQLGLKWERSFERVNISGLKVVSITTSNKEELKGKIIPFFDNHPLYGYKSMDFYKLPPYILLEQLCAAFYFAYFVLLVPILGLIEKHTL